MTQNESPQEIDLSFAQKPAVMPDFNSILAQLQQARESTVEIVQDLEKQKIEIELTLKALDFKDELPVIQKHEQLDEKPVTFELDDLDERIRRELESIGNETLAELSPKPQAQ